MPLHLRLATQADISGMARVGVAAFDQDTLCQALFPPHLRPVDKPDLDERLPFRKARIAERMNKPGSYSIVVVDDSLPPDDQVVGYAQWDGPQLSPVTEEEKEAAKRQQEEARSRYPRSFSLEAFDQLYAVMVAEEKRIFGERGCKDTWYCAVLCTDPAHARRGIGRMLLQWGISQATSEGRDVYLLATPAGILLYEKAGFEDVGRWNLFGSEHASMLLRYRPLHSQGT
ncbi:acyl-CoA N-acyltransferase [Diplogelasinospora grovesii]|uniref:Acyl-CoA N-acyltransferase n=1 Tax=Diplogelasinospora grovesii TaxID=303347 RepID=A0AAN6S643_9PEZI|nr:acyl-CoA N-acyltransferase [Diplogelasinospora grovesii]